MIYLVYMCYTKSYNDNLEKKKRKIKEGEERETERKRREKEERERERGERESMQEEKKKKDEVMREKAGAATAMASSSEKNPNFDKPPKVREEGELTSSDDDALPASTVAPSSSISAPPSISAPNASLRTYVQGINSEKPVSVSASLPARSTDTQSQTPGYCKGATKNQVLLKSSNPGWRAPGVNNNLVISFSDDDDSGSDGEERRKKNGRGINGHPQVVKTSRKPPALPNVKLDTTGRTARTEAKVAPKKVSLSRTFISSMTKIRGSSGGPSLAEQRSCLKNTKVAGRIVSSQDRGSSKNLELSSSKLQDLRQQIAMRENELKLKIVQKNKENISEPCRDVNIMGQDKVSSKKRRTMPSDVQNEPKEADRKRIKYAQNGSEQSSSSGCHVKPAESVLLLKKPLLKNVALQSGDIADPTHRNTDTLQMELLPLSDGRQSLPTSQSHRSRELQNAPAVTVSCSLSDWTSGLRESLTMPKQSALLTNSISPDPLDKSASADDTGLLHPLGRSTISGRGDVDVNSIFELEELHDKELEEAQEHRHRCEIEERNALKAYRRAQRALAEANARCTHLYRRRELYSAQLRSFVMEDSSLLWSSSQHRRIGDTWDLSNKATDVNLDLIPSSSHQLQAEFEVGNQLGYDSNVQSADGDAHCRFSGNEDGHNLGSEACSEPDASTSELLVQGNSSAANGVHSQSNDQNLSPDDDEETFPLDHRSSHANVTSRRKEDITKNSEKNMDIDSSTNFSADGSRDPLLLEAYLRSKLFSRLGVTGSLKQNEIGTNGESAEERVAEEGVAGVKPDSVPLSDRKVLNSDCGEGHKELERSISKSPLDINNQQHVKEHSLNDSPVPTFDPMDSSCPFKDIASESIIQSSSILRSAMKAACRVSLDGTEQHYGSPDTCNAENLSSQHGQDMSSLDMVSYSEEVARYASFGKIDSYTCKSPINPFWPLCMYELRGRCNNDECPWQHVKEYSSRNMNQHDNSDSSDRLTGSSSRSLKQRGYVELSSVLTPPRYLLCLDSLKAESSGSLQARQLASSQKNIFSKSMAVSSSLLKHLPSDEPYLHGNDGCVESYGGSSQLLYFQSRNATGNPLQKGSPDNDQSLEMALHVLNQEMNKIEGTKKALSLLSQALKSDPASGHLWIVYLLLYYSTKSSVRELSKMSAIGEDDFFSFAIKHNEGCYELWLLYINSRRRLDDRLAAYGRALSSMCHHGSDNDGHMMHNSAAILDLFLQMLYCLYTSGNVAKAVQRIYGLVHAERDSDESQSLLLSDILQCLTISDKCIFWVCCVYLVIYRKLPDALLQQFEFEKAICVLEWPSVRLTLEQKQQVSKLMKLAIDSVGLHTDSKSHESSSLKSAHLIAVNHVKLVAAIDGVESCKTILGKYRDSYPSCLELVLLSARAHCVGESTDSEGFEAAVSNWPKEVPGIQCIWNQYMEYVLENGSPDRAKEILEKWFHSVWTPKFLHYQFIDAGNDDNKSNLVDDPSVLNLNALLLSFNKLDLVFALLNLSLYRLFQNDLLEAQLAIDKALRVADPEVLRHCVREQGVFLFSKGSHLKKDVSACGLLDILKAYANHARAIHIRDPLTRNFIKDIQKPRLRQLVSNILSPISPDTSLVNSALDIWFGSSLLPQNSNELKDLVDFVESVLELSPANYPLVISVCRLLCRDSAAGKTKSASVFFWASSLLVNTIYRALPVPPEHVWTEAADLLGKLTNGQEISESFHQRALSIYPFSIKLWKSFLDLSKSPSKKSSVVEAARDKGIEID